MIQPSTDRYRSSLLDELLPHAIPLLTEFDTPAETSMYFGFAPIQTPRISRSDRDCAKNLQMFERSLFSCAPEEKTSLLRLYANHELYNLSHPVMVYYHRARNVGGISNDARCSHLGLDILGSSQSIADALAIKTAFSILEDEGFNDLIVDINSIGDRDSLQRFEQALTQFYRSRINEIPPKYHPVLKHNVFDMLQCNDDDQCKQINSEAPQAISFLNDASRHHFMDVLEHLEEVGIPYRISNTVVGNKHVSSQTVFVIREMNEEADKDTPALATGTRYNRLARKIRLNRDIHAVGVSLCFTPQRRRRTRKTPVQPRYFFAHLGETARRKSLALLDQLRHARIPVHHSLIHDNIRGQIARAETLKMPYVIIMGQKEATEDAVIVRNMSTMAQETVPTDTLIDYLKYYTK